jgi:hypothetical protein
MKTLLNILKWTFLLLSISFPTIVIILSIVKGAGQGLQFILLPPIFAFFMILYWWTKNLSNYLSLYKLFLSANKSLLIWVQICWLTFFVLIPLIIIMLFTVWNRFERNNPLEKFALYCYVFLYSSGFVSIIVGIIAGSYYKKKTNNLKLNL